MKIAMISSEKLPVPPFRGGAVQTYIASVAKRLAKRHSVTVYGAPDPELSADEVIDGVRYVRVDCTLNDRFTYLEAVTKQLAGTDYDVIEVFNRPMYVLPIHRAAPKSRLVLSLHNEMFRETKIPVELAKKTVEAVDEMVAVSDYICKSVSVRYPEAEPKLQPLYAGVDLEQFAYRETDTARALRREAMEDLGITEGPIIVYVGRLSRKKGPHLLIEAMPEILSQYKDAKLVLVGSQQFGSDAPNKYVRKVWEQAGALGDHILFTGYVPYKEVSKYFALGDVFVCSSQWQEPLARVHYEAMAAGIPIVTTHRGGNPEVITTGENGVVVTDWSNPEAFAQAILSILDDPDTTQQMVKNGRRLVETSFTWDTIAANLEKVLMKAGSLGPKGPVEIPELDEGELMQPGEDAEELLDQSMLADTLSKTRLRTLHSILLNERKTD